MNILLINVTISEEHMKGKFYNGANEIIKNKKHNCVHLTKYNMTIS